MMRRYINKNTSFWRFKQQKLHKEELDQLHHAEELAKIYIQIYVSVTEHIAPCPLCVREIQHCPKTRAPHGAVHHAFSSQIRGLVENLYSSGFAPAPHPSVAPHPSQNINVPPSNATVWPRHAHRRTVAMLSCKWSRAHFKCLWEISGLSEKCLPEQLSIVHSQRCTVWESYSQPKGQTEPHA